MSDRTISERIARLKKLRGSMAKDVAALDKEIAALERELRAAGFRPRKQSARPNAASMNDITVGDAAYKILRRRGGPMRLGEIVQAIEERGLYRTHSSHLRSTVATALAREARFRKVARGVYALSG